MAVGEGAVGSVGATATVAGMSGMLWAFGDIMVGAGANGGGGRIRCDWLDRTGGCNCGCVLEAVIVVTDGACCWLVNVVCCIMAGCNEVTGIGRDTVYCGPIVPTATEVAGFWCDTKPSCTAAEGPKLPRCERSSAECKGTG